MRSGLSKEQLQLLARMLREGTRAVGDPEYWNSFMERAAEPMEPGAPTWGSLVPGLGPYMATRNAVDAYKEGDTARAGNAALEAGLWLIPPSRFLNSALYGASKKVRNIPLPIAPGMFGAAMTEDERRRRAQREKLQHDNQLPAELPPKWWLPE